MDRKKYLVNVREVWVRVVEVSAESEQDAIKKVSLGEGEDFDSEYSHTLGIDQWDAEEWDD